MVQVTDLVVVVPPATSAKPLQFLVETLISLSEKLPVRVNWESCPYLSWLTEISDTAKSGVELLLPQPAKTKVTSATQDTKNLEVISF
jgi:hypothetical protein